MPGVFRLSLLYFFTLTFVHCLSRPGLLIAFSLRLSRLPLFVSLALFALHRKRMWDKERVFHKSSIPRASSLCQRGHDCA